ncbi:heavy metal atpase 1 [Artemisia annua]|uniref:Heavy metal atpase 1 n=1 Tax=Artemisia annua TaxID=35608 RepID=A0A2U1LNR9_ARTAN|nr:heavy metal atpase 1 [Artemisia annua]
MEEAKEESSIPLKACHGRDTTVLKRIHDEGVASLGLLTTKYDFQTNLGPVLVNRRVDHCRGASDCNLKGSKISTWFPHTCYLGKVCFCDLLPGYIDLRELKAKKTWKEFMLNKIVQLTEEAQLRKPTLQRWLYQFGEN